MQPWRCESGDWIEVRDAYGHWHPAIATSAPHANFGCGVVPHTIVVSVSRCGGAPINWPVEDVRKLVEAPTSSFV